MYKEQELPMKQKHQTAATPTGVPVTLKWELQVLLNGVKIEVAISNLDLDELL
jgi:hypothetical protein